MTAPDAALAEAIRHIRERALREVMAMCNRLQPTDGGYPDDPVRRAASMHGHRQARMQLYDELERMIAREAPTPAPAGYFTSDGLENA